MSTTQIFGKRKNTEVFIQSSQRRRCGNYAVSTEQIEPLFSISPISDPVSEERLSLALAEQETMLRREFAEKLNILEKENRQAINKIRQECIQSMRVLQENLLRIIDEKTESPLKHEHSYIS